MNVEDYKFMTTLIISVAGIQTTVILGFMAIIYSGLNKRLELIEKRLDNLEQSKLVK